MCLDHSLLNISLFLSSPIGTFNKGIIRAFHLLNTYCVTASFTYFNLFNPLSNLIFILICTDEEVEGQKSKKFA